MPPKAVGRGGQAAPRRAGVPPARRSDQGGEPSSNAMENAPTNATAASPTRPSVQRLQSLNRRTPGGSIAPRGGGGVGVGGGSARGIGLGLDSKPKPALKFQPRSAARRTKEERDKIQDAEAERQRKRLSEAAAIQRTRLGNAPKTRGTFRGRGQRGGPIGFGGRSAGRFDYNDSRASSTSASRYRTPNSRGLGADYSSDEDSEALRISIDHINLEDDGGNNSEDEIKAKKGKRAARSSMRSLSIGPRPVRVERHEHEERVVSVNVEASSSISADLRRQAHEDDDSDNELFVSGEPETTQPDQGESLRKIKPEPTDGDVAMADLPHADSELADDETPLPPQTIKARKRISVKDPRSLLRTKEEIEEFDRHVDDLETLKNILTPGERAEKAAKATEGIQKEGEDGTETKQEAAAEEEEEPEKNAGRLFLIQFPPLTPNLVVPGVGEEGVIEVQDDGTEDVTITHESTTATLGESGIKREEDETEDIKPKIGITSEPAGNVVTATQRQMPAGRVGKLHLHKSGRVTLDWGGISFELDKGASVNFVQQALIASNTATTENADDGAGERCVWAMGQLSEKFIASPEWDKLL